MTSTSTAAPPASDLPAEGRAAAAQAAPGSSGSGFAAIPPPTEAPPTGQVVGPDGQRAVFMTEEQYFQESLPKESHALHIGVIGFGVVLALLISAGSALGNELGVGGMVGAMVGVMLTIALGTLLNSCIGWLVGKMFDADFGSFPIMLLRFAAVTAAYSAVLAGLSAVMGSLFAVFLVLPVLMILVVVLIGMDMMQALVFTVVLAVANWVLTSFVLLSLASLTMS
jgi:hypothetical protein